MENKVSRLQILTKGIIKENPNLVLLLGTCPTLATTSSAFNGMGMGIAASFVLICSNIVISLLAKIIPDKVRIPCYIVVIAGFVTLVQFIVQAYAVPMYNSLGVFLPLIVVNCIILGRAEMFANKNGVLDSALDGIGMGLGFTLSLTVMGAIRELIGNGTLLSGFFLGDEALQESLTIHIPFVNEHPMLIIALAPGGFFVYASIIAFVNWLINRKGGTPRDFACGGCALASMCTQEKCVAELGEIEIPAPKAMAAKAEAPKMSEEEKAAKIAAAKAAKAAKEAAQAEANAAEVKSENPDPVLAAAENALLRKKAAEQEAVTEKKGDEE